MQAIAIVIMMLAILGYFSEIDELQEEVKRGFIVGFKFIICFSIILYIVGGI